MRLPQYDQKLDLWPAELFGLAELLRRWVNQQAALATAGRSLGRVETLMLKPCTGLAFRLHKFGHHDVAIGRKKVRSVKVHYDEMLLLHMLVHHFGVPGTVPDPYGLIMQIDQKSLNLVPAFARPA
jgi:hypothetical protein